jgi:CDGSH-type Zn-finger protein
MSKQSDPSINPAPNGPYLVKNLERLTNQKGSVETKETIALCRCGASNNKPFCDGAHKKIGFDSDKQADRVPDKRDNFVGANITIHDNRGLCAHAGLCTEGLPKVFKYRQEPWIDADAESAEKIVATVRACPSGALSYSIDAVEPPEPGGEPAIFISPNGPYVVTGGIDLENTETGEGVSKKRFALCRCGASKNKPFCDGAHWSTKFEDDKN